jgi:hypothetical protein
MQTVGDLDKAFRLYVDKADSQGSADFLVGERQRFLNDAQLRLARELAADKSDDQDAVDARRSLQAYAEIVPGNGGGSNGVALPDNYLRYGNARVQLKAPYDHYNVTVRIISQDELSKLLEDPFNAPTIGEPVACFLNGEARLYPGNAFASFDLHYYKRWAALDLNQPDSVPEAGEEHHPTIVQYAVQLALESVQDPRFQTQAAVAKLTANP